MEGGDTEADGSLAQPANNAASANTPPTQAPQLSSLIDNGTLRRQGYFNSVMTALPAPLTRTSVCVRSRGLKRTSPDLLLLMTLLPSGAVDFRTPSSSKTTTASLSLKCIGVGSPGFHR